MPDNTSAPPKLLLDGHCYDFLCRDGLDEALGDLHEAGACSVLTTSAQIIEFAEIPDTRIDARRQHIHALTLVRPRVVPSVYLLGTPLTSGAMGATEEEEALFKQLSDGMTSARQSHQFDRVMAVAARREGATLITDDAPARRRIERLRICPVWSYDALTEWIRAHSEP